MEEKRYSERELGGRIENVLYTETPFFSCDFIFNYLII
jgi:hypothetical protein